MDAAAGLAPPPATDHPPEITHVPQTSGADQGMMQHQSFQALHNESLQAPLCETHMDMGGSHAEPGTASALTVATYLHVICTYGLFLEAASELYHVCRAQPWETKSWVAEGHHSQTK